MKFFSPFSHSSPHSLIYLIFLAGMILHGYSQATMHLVIKDSGHNQNATRDLLRSRFYQIWINHDYTDITYGFLFNYTLLVSPNPTLTSLAGSLNLCDNSTYQGLIQTTGINPLQFCNSYFCNSTTTPYYLQPTVYSLNNHIALQRFCTQCNITTDQEFAFSNSNCTSNMSPQCYPGRCAGNSSCIVYDYLGAICYVWDQKIYYRWNDYIHNTVYWIYFSTMDYIALGLYLAVTIFYILVAFIPEIVYRAKTIDKTMPLQKKILHFLSLKSFAIVFILFGLVIYDIMLIIDCLGLTIYKVAYFGTCLTFPTYWISFMSIVVKWHHIINQVESNSTENIGVKRSMVLISFCLAFSVWYAIGIGLCIWVLSYTANGPGMYILGVYCVISIVIFIIMNTVLSIFSLRILWMTTRKGEMTQSVFTASFSKMVIWLILGSVPINIDLIYSACCLLIGTDVFSFSVWIFYIDISTVLLLFCYIFAGIAFLRGESLRWTYLWCVKCEKA
jgi:hypothetical protein